MITVLDPIVDADAVRAAKASRLRYVDGWATAWPDLCALDRTISEWDDRAIECASRYVVYPWRATLVRLPGPDLFWRLRTSRNRYLITDDEQRCWSGAWIGVAGLSVGAAAVSVCGLTGARRFRLADPDTLSPTNLNRLPGSVCDLGIPKLELARRRLLEADPYSEIAGFADGYAPTVAAAFLGAGADRLAVLIEEMDDFAMKLDIRRRARRAGVPVVMATDNGDNAILDVERYDLDPGYPMFHGLAGVLDELDEERPPVPADRIRLAGAIVGDDITARTRFSLGEVGRSLPAWPQLGTAATLSGALAGYVARLIVCGEPVDSGRYRVDLDRIVQTPPSVSSPAAVR